MKTSEIQSKIQKKSLVSEIIGFELVALKSLFSRERILVIGSQFVNSLEILDTTKTNIFQLKFSQSDGEIR